MPEWYYNKSDLTISNRITTVIVQSGREGQTKYPGGITTNKSLPNLDARRYHTSDSKQPQYRLMVIY